METFKAYLLIVGFIGALGFGGYWAATSLQDPVRVVNTDEIQVVAQTPVQTVSQDENNSEEAVAGVTDEVEEDTPEETQEESASGTYSDLISRLQDLIDDNILMKNGSRGTRVGTVQEFLNLYNDTTGGIDNDFGPGTESRVRDFQREEGLTADGQAGPNTYRAMIEWLNEQ